MAFWNRKKSPLDEALAMRAHWYDTGDPASPLKATVRCEPWRILVRASPEGERIFLNVEGNELGEVQRWPREWTVPGDEPGALRIVLMILRGHA